MRVQLQRQVQLFCDRHLLLLLHLPSHFPNRGQPPATSKWVPSPSSTMHHSESLHRLTKELAGAGLTTACAPRVRKMSRMDWIIQRWKGWSISHLPPTPEAVSRVWRGLRAEQGMQPVYLPRLPPHNSPSTTRFLQDKSLEAENAARRRIRVESGAQHRHTERGIFLVPAPKVARTDLWMKHAFCVFGLTLVSSPVAH